MTAAPALRAAGPPAGEGFARAAAQAFPETAVWWASVLTLSVSLSVAKYV